jgi:hypothetical protein
MKATVYSNTLIIGHTHLLVGDESMGCLWGNLTPTDDYYKFVQKSVWEFWSTDKPDYKKWYSLNINIQLENGYFLYPIGGITFDDVEELPGETIRIDIAGLFPHIIEDFFQSDPVVSFIEEPWITIDIEQKLLFEAELQKEIKKAIGYGESIQSTTNHILADYKCSAVCQSMQADDILFSIHGNNGSDKSYALVHLTFSGKQEEDPQFPFTILYDSFDAFKFKRMYPDKENWED